MSDHSKAKKEFSQKLDKLQKEIQPALYGHNLKEIVLYEKMLEMQDQIRKLTGMIEKNNDLA